MRKRSQAPHKLGARPAQSRAHWEWAIANLNNPLACFSSGLQCNIGASIQQLPPELSAVRSIAALGHWVC
eukprot:4442411-Amphidinium_carterae.1